MGLKSCVDKPRRDQTKSESTPAASDKCVEKESCFEYIPNVGALQKSHVLKFQKRSRNRIGDSEFDFTIMIAFLHATKAESQTSRHHKDLCHHTSGQPRYPVHPQHFGPAPNCNESKPTKCWQVMPTLSVPSMTDQKALIQLLNLHGTHATAGILLQITVTQHSDAFYGPQNRVREKEGNGAPLRWGLPGSCQAIAHLCRTWCCLGRWSCLFVYATNKDAGQDPACDWKTLLGFQSESSASCLS